MGKGRILLTLFVILLMIPLSQTSQQTAESRGIIWKEVHDPTVKRLFIEDTEYPYEIDIDLGTYQRTSTKCRSVDGSFLVNDIDGSYVNSGNRYLGLTVNSSLDSGSLTIYNKDGSLYQTLQGSDFTHLNSKTWNGNTYNDIYYRTWSNLPNGTHKDFTLEMCFNERPELMLLYFGTGSSVIKVLEGASRIDVNASACGGLNAGYIGTPSNNAEGGINWLTDPYNTTRNWLYSSAGRPLLKSGNSVGYDETSDAECRVTSATGYEVNVTCMDVSDGYHFNYTHRCVPYIDFEASIPTGDQQFRFSIGDADLIKDAELYFARTDYDFDGTTQAHFDDVATPIDSVIGYARDNDFYFAYLALGHQHFSDFKAQEYASATNHLTMFIDPMVNNITGRFGFSNFTLHTTPPTANQYLDAINVLEIYNTSLSPTDVLGTATSYAGGVVKCASASGSCDFHVSNTTALYPEDRKYDAVTIEVSGFTSGTDTIFYLLNSTSTSAISNTTDYWGSARNMSGSTCAGYEGTNSWYWFDKNGVCKGELGNITNQTSIYDDGTNLWVFTRYTYENAFGATNTIHVRVTLNDPSVAGNAPRYVEGSIASSVPDGSQYLKGRNHGFQSQWSLDAENATFEWGHLNGSNVNYTLLTTPAVSNDTSGVYIFNHTELEVCAHCNYSWIGINENGENRTTITSHDVIRNTTVDIHVALNGSEANKTYTNPDVVNSTAWAGDVDTSPTITLLREALSQGVGIRVEDNETLGNATWNFSYHYAQSQNYSERLVEVFAHINKAGGEPVHIDINFTEANFTTGWGNVTNTTVYSSLPTLLYRNGTAVTSPDIQDLGAGVHNYTGVTNHNNYTQNVTTRWLTITGIASGLSLSASPGWSVTEGTSATITCSASGAVGTPNLYKDGVNVTSPYTAALDFATYNFTCDLGASGGNYTPTSDWHWFTVTSGGFGCTSNSTYAFRKTITTGGNASMILNFTDLVKDNYVRDDFQDVYVNKTTYKNFTTTGEYYLIVTTGGDASFIVYFGNYVGNKTHTAYHDTIGNATEMTAYTEQNPFYVIKFLDESTGGQQLPPSSNRTMRLYCQNGMSSFNISDSKILVATFERLNETRTDIEYSVTETYYRNLLVDSDVEYKNMYLVDANQDQVVEMEFKLYDVTGDFAGSKFKVKKYLEGSLRTITEQIFDAEDKAIAYLINNDKYQLYVDNDAEERSIGNIYVDSSDLDKTLTIGYLNTTNLTYANVSADLKLESGEIKFTWIDYSEETTEVELWVWNYTNQTQQLHYASSTNHSRVEFTYTVPDANATYLVRYLIHSGIYGEDTTGETVALEGSEKAAMNKPAAFPLITLVTELGGSATLWLVLLVILPIPMMFVERNLGIAAFLMVTVVAAFYQWDLYITLAPWVLGFGLLVAVMIEIKNRRKRKD